MILNTNTFVIYFRISTSWLNLEILFFSVQSKMDKVFAIHFKDFQSNCWIKHKIGSIYRGKQNKSSIRNVKTIASVIKKDE